MQRFTPAGQAEVVRAFQKDDVIIGKISDQMTEQLLEVIGNSPERSRLVSAAKLAAKYVYYVCTTLAGYQTVGEEYSGIVLVDKHGLAPSKLALWWMVVLKCSGPALVSRLIKKCEHELESPTLSADFTPELQANLKITLKVIKEILPYLLVFNNGLFYLYGGSLYEPAKWLAGIHYAIVRFWHKDTSSQPVFNILGIVSLLYFSIVMIRAWLNMERHQPQDVVDYRSQSSVTEAANPKSRCLFCLEARRNTSITPCGHLFCWQCLMEGLQVKEECPVCREKVQPSRVVLLQNYDGTE